MSKCIICNQRELTTGDIGNTCTLCRLEQETSKGNRQQVQVYGWICPVCGRGNSPFSNTCPCEPYPTPVITSMVPPPDMDRSEGDLSAQSHVFRREECIFQYCPHPELCKDSCQNRTR